VKKTVIGVNGVTVDRRRHARPRLGCGQVRRRETGVIRAQFKRGRRPCAEDDNGNDVCDEWEGCIDNNDRRVQDGDDGGTRRHLGTTQVSSMYAYTRTSPVCPLPSMMNV